MNLQTALFRLWVADSGSQSNAARAIGVSRQLVSFIHSGNKRVTPKIAAKIEAASAGKYRKEQLVFGEAANTQRPDQLKAA